MDMHETGEWKSWLEHLVWGQAVKMCLRVCVQTPASVYQVFERRGGDPSRRRFTPFIGSHRSLPGNQDLNQISYVANIEVKHTHF